MTKEQYLNLPRRPKKLFLGEEFIVSIGAVKPRHCRFIKVTEKGYNFLNLKTNVCILKNHLYQSKAANHIEGNWFFIRTNINLEKIINGKNLSSTGSCSS